MNYTISKLSIVPIRSSASNKSEQLSQLLFGEMAEVLEKKGRLWQKIRCIHDNAVGWVESNQLLPITAEEFEDYQKNFAFSLDLLQPALGLDHALPIPIGARLPAFDGLRFSMGGRSYSFSGQAVFPENLASETELLLKFAKKYLFAPFQHGGRSPLGIDAAGLIQNVFELIGTHLPRLASQQVFSGAPVDFIDQALPGDIAFFENRAGRIAHAGILLEDGKIIHASGFVRIDSIDHYGIFDDASHRYTHKLRVIRRVLLPSVLPDNAKQTENTSVSNQIELF